MIFVAKWTNLFFCPKLLWGSWPRSDQNIFSPKTDQSGAVVVFTSAFCSKVLVIFDRFDHHPEKKDCTLGYVDFRQNFNGRRFSISQTISVSGITMRSLKLADLWHFQTNSSHFRITNTTKLSKRRGQTDNSKSVKVYLNCFEGKYPLLY